MYSRPFSAQKINTFEENSQNYIPFNFCGQTIPVLQNQQRKVIDTLKTSLHGMPIYCPVRQSYPNGMPGFCPAREQNYSNMTNGIPGFKQEDHSNRITFTFDRNAGTGVPQNVCQCQSRPLENLAQLQRYAEFNQSRLQKLLNQPYQPKDHLDNQTSTTDLTAEHRHKEKKNKSDVDFNRNEEKEKQKKQDGGCQVKLCCDCDEDEEKALHIRQKKKKKGRKKSLSDLCLETDDDDDDRR